MQAELDHATVSLKIQMRDEMMQKTLASIVLPKMREEIQYMLFILVPT